MKLIKNTFGTLNSAIYLILLQLLYSCSNSKDVTVRIPLEIGGNTDHTQIPYQVSILNLIQLETTPESIFGNIDRIEFYKGRFYILDVFNSKSLLVFDRYGNFLSKTKYGKGPGEIINPFAFCVDKTKDDIIIWDQTLNTLFTFDLDLNLKSKEVLSIFISDLAKIEDKFLVQSQNRDSYSYILYSNDFQQIHSRFDFPFRSSGGGMYFQRSMSIGHTDYFFIAPNDYNIYKLKIPTINKEYFLDFGDTKMINEDLSKTSIGNVWNLIRSGAKVSFPIDLFESESFMCFQVIYQYSHNTYFVPKDGNGGAFSINDFFSGSLPECKIRGSLNSEDIFYGEVNPRNIINSNNMDLIERFNGISVNMDQNPLILIIEFKPKINT